MDVPAQIYRIDLFRHYGFVLWDSQWYSGHAVPSYSALFPAAAATFGLYPTVAVSAGAAAWSFDSLARASFGRGASVASAVFAAGLLVPVAIGQFPFLSGAGAGLLVLVAARRRRRVLAVLLAFGCVLLSPVAGAFLIVALIAWALTSCSAQRVLLTTLGLVCALPLIALGLVFPDTGRFPFWSLDFCVTMAVCGLGLVFVPAGLRAIRTGLVLYAASAIVLFVVPNPMGGNFGRLCATFAPALALLFGTVRKRWLLVVLAVPLLVWQWSPAMATMTSTTAAPSSRMNYYRPLLEFFETQRTTGRVEVPFTAGHWEAAFVAPQIALARGWERQLDVADNPIFYDGARLTAARYRAWLDASGVQWVALPDVAMDYSAVAETRLLRRPPPYLKLAWHNRHWRVWHVEGSSGIVHGAGSLESMGPDHLTVNAIAPGVLDLRVRYTPMWNVVSGRACVGPGSNGWTKLIASAPGRIEVTTSIISSGGTCDGR